MRQSEPCVLDLSPHMTIQDVAHHFGVSWDVVKSIQERYLKRKLSSPRLKGLRRIAIDEIFAGKKRKLLTIVLDLKTGAAVFMGEGKGAAALEPFRKRLKSARKRIEALAIDMSQADIHAVATNLPKAVLAFDHLHVIELFNEKLPDLRRELYRELTDLLQSDARETTQSRYGETVHPVQDVDAADPGVRATETHYSDTIMSLNAEKPLLERRERLVTISIPEMYWG
jgi:transposase